MNTARFLTFVCTLLATALPALAQDTPDTRNAQNATIRPAKVFTVVEVEARVERSYPAIVLPSREVELSFRVSGQLIELPILAATQVVAGDVIAKLDPRDFERQIAQLQSQVDQAEAELTALRTGAREEEIAVLEANVSSAQAQFDQAQDNLSRIQELVVRQVATTAQLEAAQAEFGVAGANLRAQQEQLGIGQVGGRPEDIAAAEAALRGLKVQLQVAEDDLEDATLTAPFDGIIGRRDIDNFSNIQAGQTVALLQGLDVVHLAFDIPGPDVTSLTVNGTDAITNTAIFDAIPGVVFESETVEFSVQADASTQTYRGRAAVTVPEGEIILPGMVAEVTASTEVEGFKLEVPLTAVAASPNGTPFVWLLGESNQVFSQEITLGEANDSSVEVTSGLTAGDVIIAAGVSQILEGMTVRPITQVGN